MRYSVKRRSLIAVLSAFFAFFMLFAGLNIKKASANTNLETVTLTSTMKTSASMRLDEPTGMRFGVELKENDLTNFDDNVKVVVMITQKKLLDKAGLTVDTFTKDSEVTKAEISFTKDEFPVAENGTIQLLATILEVKDENISKTYVAKTYVSDGNKIGYVTNATVASIYDTASYWINEGSYNDNEEFFKVLQRYSKSYSVTINSNDEVLVASYSAISELFTDLPECTTVKSIVDAEGNSVSLDSFVTADLALTVEYAYNHAWENGECAHCDEVCEHSWTDGVCTVCEAVCEHPSHTGLVCDTCQLSAPTTYNACMNAGDLKAWQWATSSTTMKTNELYQETVTSAGGKTGNFLRLQAGLAGRTIPSFIGVTIAPTITFTQLNALKSAGFESLSVDYYFENDADSAVKSAVKDVVKNDVFTYGEDITGSYVRENVGEWHTLTIDIQKIIDNYEGLMNATKYILMIRNYSGYTDHSTVFYTYFGNMQFVKGETTVSTTYNACDNTAEVRAYGLAYDSTWANNTDGFTISTVNSVGGKDGNFLRVIVGRDSNGVQRMYSGLSILPDLTLAQIQALQKAGYEKLSVDYYFEHYDGASNYTYKSVQTGVWNCGEDPFDNFPYENKNLNEWHNFTVDIQDIINNYEGLANGSKFLMFIRNYNAYGDNAYNATEGYGTFSAYFGNMEFVK